MWLSENVAGHKLPKNIALYCRYLDTIRYLFTRMFLKKVV